MAQADMSSPRPFQIRVPDGVLEDIRAFARTLRR